MGGFGAQGGSPGEGIFAKFLSDGIGRLVDGLILCVYLGVEEFRIGRGLGELGESDTDEANGSEGVGPEVEEGFGSVMDHRSFVGLRIECNRAGDGFEITEADFDGDGFGKAVVFAQAGSDIAGLPCDDGADFVGVVEVGVEGVFVGDVFRAAVDADGSIVEASR